MVTQKAVKRLMAAGCIDSEWYCLSVLSSGELNINISIDIDIFAHKWNREH